MKCIATGKICFTKREAHGAINEIYRNRNGRGGRCRQRRNRPDTMRSYHCDFCNYFHLSSH
jgi:hypothetical protein